ncbi:MAG: diacylglycerol kinase family protein [Hyphomonadaceae bacterium]
MKVSALINPAAGSVGLDGSRRMKLALSSAGIEHAEIIAFDPMSANKQISEFISKSPDLLIIWGGDGTHRTALHVAGLEFDKLLLLPGGGGSTCVGAHSPL